MSSQHYSIHIRAKLIDEANGAPFERGQEQPTPFGSDVRDNKK